MVAVIIGREFAVTTLRSLAYARGVAIPASPLGKIKMVAQVVAILALILAHGQTREFLLIGQAALWVVVVDRAGVGAPTTSAASTSSLARASPTADRSQRRAPIASRLTRDVKHAESQRSDLALRSLRPHYVAARRSRRCAPRRARA